MKANASVFLFVGFLPVMEVGFEHEGVVSTEHAVDEQPDENAERNQEEILPVVPR